MDNGDPGKSTELGITTRESMEGISIENSNSSEQLDPTPEQCIHFTGGSEFNEPLRLRRLKEQNPENYKQLANQLQDLVGDIVGTIPIGKFKETKKYLSTVLRYRHLEHRKRILRKLHDGVIGYPGDLFLWSDEEDHIHFVHDCPCSNGSCRCGIFKEEDFRGMFRSNLRGTRFINELDWIDWINVFLYFVYSKWPNASALWSRGRLRRSPTAGEIIRWKDLCRTSQGTVLEGENTGTGYNDVGGQSTSEDGRGVVSTSDGYTEKAKSNGSGREGPARKRVRTESLPKPGKFQRILQKTETILNMSCVIPPTHARELFVGPEAIELHNPTNDKYYEAACKIWSMKFNRWTFGELNEFYKNKTPIFYANDINPFVYYHDRETSFKVINELIQHQCGTDPDNIRDFLVNMQSWFNKQGWNGNPKCNGICVVGPANSGKNYFFDMYAALACNVGHIGRVNNKTNQFALQDIVNRRLVIGNEISMEDGAKEDMKKVFEGTACNVRVKFQGDKIFTKTPVIVISNYTLDICYDPLFKDVRLHTMEWFQADLLKHYTLKPYPLCLFDIYNHYDVYMV